MREWTYRKTGILGDSDLGPFTDAQIKELIESGDIKHDTLVHVNGKWYRAGDILSRVFEHVRQQKDAAKEAASSSSIIDGSSISNPKRGQPVIAPPPTSLPPQMPAVNSSPLIPSSPEPATTPAVSIRTQTRIRRPNKAKTSSPGNVAALGAATCALGAILISPLFRWIRFGSGGAQGIQGDGWIVVTVTAIVLAVYLIGLMEHKARVIGLLLSQAWGIVTVIWMGYLIFAISNVMNKPELQNNPFAAVFALQIGPGEGLYIGLIGGMALTFATGYLAIHELASARSLPLLFISQALGIAIAATLILFFSQDNDPRSWASSSSAGNTDAGSKTEVPQVATKPQLTGTEDDYIRRHLKLYDLEAKIWNSLLKGRIPGVTFKLRNTGSRTLGRVEVVVYFQDRRGRTIAEKSFVPVSDSPFAKNSPLRPNYIWQLPRDEFLQAEEVPAEWAEGKVEAKITAIEFVD